MRWKCRYASSLAPPSTPLPPHQGSPSHQLTLGRGHTLIACGRSSIDRHCSHQIATLPSWSSIDRRGDQIGARFSAHQTPDICQLICLPHQVNLCWNKSVANSNLKPQSTLCKSKVHWWFLLLFSLVFIHCIHTLLHISNSVFFNQFCCINKQIPPLKFVKDAIGLNCEEIRCGAKRWVWP